VLDLAGDADFAHDFKEQFQQRGYTLLLPPMVVAELNENFEHGVTAQKRELARRALLHVLAWNLSPVNLTALQSAIAERFAGRLLDRRLLPDEEFSDALILAETSVSGIPLLVTSDRHLLDVDADALALAFNDADLSPVHPVHPKALLKALR
jgi:hypothetical protein